MTKGINKSNNRAFIDNKTSNITVHRILLSLVTIDPMNFKEMTTTFKRPEITSPILESIIISNLLINNKIHKIIFHMTNLHFVEVHLVTIKQNIMIRVTKEVINHTIHIDSFRQGRTQQWTELEVMNLIKIKITIRDKDKIFNKSSMRKIILTTVLKDTMWLNLKIKKWYRGWVIVNLVHKVKDLHKYKHNKIVTNLRTHLSKIDNNKDNLVLKNIKTINLTISSKDQESK